jgi:TonB family protein
MKSKLLVCFGSLVFLAPGVALAQSNPKPADLDRRVFIDVSQAAPFEVLAELSSVIGSYLNPDTAISSTPVTLRIWNVRARTALDALCDTVGCRWQLEGRTLRVTMGDPPPSPPRSAEFFARLKRPLEGSQWTFTRTPLRDVTSALSVAVGERVVFEGADLNALVTVDLNGVSPYRAVFKVMAAIGWDTRKVAWEGVNDPGGPIVLRASGSEDRGAGPPRPPSDRVYDPNEPGLTAPRVIFEVRPLYTADSMRAKVQGKVVLLAVVLSDGTVGDVNVQESLSPELDAEAIRAAKRWRFEPARKDGKPVGVRVVLELLFTLRE